MAALLVAALTPAPAPAAPEYVALGDSYAAGVGADRASCGRDRNAYPELYAATHRLELEFAACSGATTGDVARQAERITGETSLVTVTVGGNDAGFSDVLTTCVLRSEEKCLRRVDTAEEFIEDELPRRLDALYRSVRERTSARVVVLGYPHLFDTDGRCGMSKARREALNGASDRISEVLRDRAEAAGFAYADVRDEFEGHGVCSDDPWIHDLTFPVGDSFHPNAAGHRHGYLKALTRATA
ncbi:SGNH/GDSL hydrolase family protein [Saccharothrix australiensis]|nr:SGNH/GDSL hydrolase family protein [Saccharothrix australiensis]